MRVVRTILELRAAISELTDSDPKRSDKTITDTQFKTTRLVGMVPTMGALHEGHLSLVRAARKENAVVVVSIFVNPAQFTEDSDFTEYPRTEVRDVRLAASAGADLIFVPSVEEMYPSGFATSVRVGGIITSSLEGAVRGSSHFDGVTTVVTKLLLAALPDSAYFGAKDAQQIVVVQRMVADLGIPTRIVVCPTSRENDGLARSSRNERLTKDERSRAVAIPQALDAAAVAVAEGESDPEALRELVLRVLKTEELDPEYIAFVDPSSLEPVAEVNRPTLLLLAVRVGDVRLLDNVHLLNS